MCGDESTLKNCLLYTKDIDADDYIVDISLVESPSLVKGIRFKT
jgi:hypothetical protein